MFLINSCKTFLNHSSQFLGSCMGRQRLHQNLEGSQHVRRGKLRFLRRCQVKNNSNISGDTTIMNFRLKSPKKWRKANIRPSNDFTHITICISFKLRCRVILKYTLSAAYLQCLNTIDWENHTSSIRPVVLTIDQLFHRNCCYSLNKNTSY